LHTRSHEGQWGRKEALKEGTVITTWLSLLLLFVSSLSPAFGQPTSPSPDLPTKVTVETLVRGYVDHDFIHEQLPPPPQCEQYTEKLMFAYDWQVTVNTIGPYDAAHQQVPVTATILVRCGPLHPQPSSSGKSEPSTFPVQVETPIDFQLGRAPEQAQQWVVQDVTLWKSKQRVREP
jgi:hypothetical protein